MRRCCNSRQREILEHRFNISTIHQLPTNYSPAHLDSLGLSRTKSAGDGFILVMLVSEALIMSQDFHQYGQYLSTSSSMKASRFLQFIFHCSLNFTGYWIVRVHLSSPLQ